jgi:hypothetical protein
VQFNELPVLARFFGISIQERGGPMRLQFQSVLTGAAALPIVGLMFVALISPAAWGDTPTPAEVAGIPAVTAGSATISAPLADPASAVRGSLGFSLEDLSLSGNLGRQSLLLNGGFALLFGLLAVILGRRRSSRRRPAMQYHPAISVSTTDGIDAA